MQRTFAMGPGANAVVAAGLWLAVAALNPQPARAQFWAAIAVSPSTLDFAEAHAYTSQAGAESWAFQSCTAVGAKDCKVLASVYNQCLALATTPVKSGAAKKFGNATSATRQGAAALALAACAKAGGNDCRVVISPCALDNPGWGSPLAPPPPDNPPLSVDPGLVGDWQANINGGIWLWQLAANGTYTFVDETPVKSVPTDGSFGASNGKYTLHSYVTVWDDQGTYTIQPGGNSVVFSGKLGTNTWTRSMFNPFTTAPVSGGGAPQSGPTPGVNIRK
jgi:hypothetical protein